MPESEKYSIGAIYLMKLQLKKTKKEINFKKIAKYVHTYVHTYVRMQVTLFTGSVISDAYAWTYE